MRGAVPVEVSTRCGEEEYGVKWCGEKDMVWCRVRRYGVT